MRSRTQQSSSAIHRAAAIGTALIGAVATCVLAGCSPRSSSNDSPLPTSSVASTADAAGADGKMVPAYEDATTNFQIFTQAGDPDPTASTLGVEEATYAHELGHMVIDLYDLPAAGREEDDADQMSAFLLLQPDDKGHLDPTNVTSIIDSAREFDAISQAPGDFDESAFYDVHSLNQTREYNLLCWAYGADPARQADLVDSGRLPQDRADSCESEWNKLDRAWSTLLDPHLKR